MATDADLIAKYRQYNPNYDIYTDEEITQIGLPGFEQPKGLNTVPNQFTYSNKFMNDMRNLPNDFRNSLTETKDALVEDFSGLQNIIGSGVDRMQQGLGFVKDKTGQGFNLARQLPGMALSAMTGIPGIGLALGALGKMGSNEYAQATTANMQKQNNNLQSLGLDGVSNFGGVTTDDLGRITNNGLNYNTPEGIMSGYNSGFDLAGAALDRIGTIQNAIEKGRFKDKFALDRANKKIDNLKTAAVASAQAKRQAYQDKIDNAKNQAAQDRARTKSITAGYGGYDNSPGATGPTAAGAGMGVGGGYASDYGFLKDGGSVGLASMFTRRG
jgi:hypothetical protein